MTPTAAILIVDDRPEKLLSLEAVLEDLGQTIVRARSGREALRQVLARDFAVILLDVNMPDMDGFETASLIRQRRNSRDTPIIFVTAFGDEMHASRGYSLGAVDYILAPVLPEVLRTKVAVFVDLYAKTEQIRQQAESLRGRASQLQKLAAASVAINGALSVEAMLRTVTDTARDVVGSHQAITLFLLRAASTLRPARTLAFTSFSDRHAAWRGRELQLDAIAATLVAGCRTATRMTEAELHRHPDWEIVRNVDIPPIRGGMLTAPLCGRDGNNLGVIYLCEREEGEFTSDDEAILVQLAQMGSIALENSLYAEEREANRVKDEFLATLSHELRTPLNAILGWTQLLRMEAGRAGAEGVSSPAIADPQEVAHGLEVIERNARSQTKLIEDLLDVSRITTGKMRLNVRRVPLAAIARAAADAARPGLESREITLELSVDPSLDEVRIAGDPDRLQQVFWNLLSNAIKFTPAGGRITCRVERDGDASLRVRLTDSGAGISPSFLPFVFDRFRQADSSSTRQHGGLGIGLTVVRHIVELHGGTVTADSAGEGQGATFIVTLPLTPAAVDGAAGLPGLPPPVDAPPPPAALADLKGMRVLIVDDEPDAREVLGQFLSRAGAEVAEAGSAAEAFAAFRRAPPDVLVSDIAMPERDGISLIRAVRALPAADGGAVPAIALTAYAREEDRQRSLAAGFQAHLAKPVDPGELANALVALAADRPGEQNVSAAVPSRTTRGVMDSPRHLNSRA